MAGADAATIAKEGGAFVFFPNRYAHDSWRGELLAGPLWSLLGDCPRTEGRLAAFVTERAQLGTPSLPRFDTPAERFCLLPAPAVLAVGQRLGVCLNAGRIGRLIDGKLVSRLKRELGAEAYDFALRRAPLITTQSDPLQPDIASEGPLLATFERSGINFIALALVELEAGLRARFRLRLPKVYASQIDRPTGTVQPTTAWQVVRKVAREVEPQWSALLG